MKLRIENQTVRFRLSPEDLLELETQKALVHSLKLSPQNEWQYGITLSSNENVRADSSRIEVQLPLDSFSNWSSSAEIEWILHHRDLELIIEKDLKPHRR